MFFATPIHEEVKINSIGWEYSIDVGHMEAVKHYNMAYLPEGAYNVNKRFKTVTTPAGKGRMTTHTYIRYDYTRDEFIHESYSVSQGEDKNTYWCEPELKDGQCIGSRKEKYFVYVLDKNGYHQYETTKDIWNTVEIGGSVTITRYRFGKTILDVAF